ncbi:MAG: hypothetical protein IJ514_05300 [Clostridia bacterium]|nr:hypothetical protein [Clostridia bacterium]
MAKYESPVLRVVVLLQNVFTESPNESPNESADDMSGWNTDWFKSNG